MSAERPLLVLISGPPGAGKTMLASQLTPRLQLPLIAKDIIKESLSDAFRKTSLAWSRRIGGATWETMFTLVERFIADGASVIFEGNFYPERQREWFVELGRRHPYAPFELHCTAEYGVLKGRIRDRERHPVHHHLGTSPRMIATNGALELDGNVLRLDTSDSQPFDLNHIVTTVRGI